MLPAGCNKPLQFELKNISRIGQNEEKKPKWVSFEEDSGQVKLYWSERLGRGIGTRSFVIVASEPESGVTEDER